MNNAKLIQQLEDLGAPDLRVMVVSRTGVADDIESIILEPLMEGQPPVLQLRAFKTQELKP